MNQPISILLHLDCGCPGGNNRAEIKRAGITTFHDDPAEAVAQAVRQLSVRRAIDNATPEARALLADAVYGTDA